MYIFKKDSSDLVKIKTDTHISSFTQRVAGIEFIHAHIHHNNSSNYVLPHVQ